MKRRVRGLLHRKWHTPLLALVLAGLPMLLTTGLALLLFNPLPSWLESLRTLFTGLIDSPQNFVLNIMAQLASPTMDLTGFISTLPGLAIWFGVYFFVGMPVSVSLSGYFLNFLRGKKTSVLEVFGCFSGRYPRALGGMMYMFFWVVIWAFAAFFVPVPLCSLGLRVIGYFAESLGMYQIPVSVGLLIVCVVWFVVFTVLFINRMFAYSLTATCIAAQPRLSAYRAVRLSRKLMRGYKMQLIKLYLSFLLCYLPSLIALAVLLLLPVISPMLSLTGILQQSVRLFLYIIIGVNQLVLVYVAPYAAACFRAFYIERKREALMDEEVTPDDFATKPRKEPHA